MLRQIGKLPGEQRPLFALLVAFFVAVFLRAWGFYWFHGLPALYAKDLGVNYIVADYIRNNVHSARDFFDMLSWSSWWDQPMFFLNGYVSYAVLVPIADVVHSTWASVKFVEIAQSIAACAGTYWLLRLFQRPKIWALAAGTLFASVPIVALTTRGNLDIGWPTTCAPLCLALGIVCIRRNGLFALPAVGVLCSLCGLCPALEYGIFVSIPLYLVLAAFAFDRAANKLRWLLAATCGLVALVALGAYFLVPTFSTDLFTDSATRATSLASESFAPDFSQSFTTVFALLLTEFLRSPNVLYNATPQVPYALVGGTTLWLFAVIGFLRHAGSIRRSAFGIVAVATGVALVYVSVSALMPGGGALWHFIGHVPLLRAIRIPDRYFIIAVLPVVLLAIDGIRACAEAVPSQRSIGAIAVGIVLCLFGYVDVSQQFWTNQQDYGSEEPALQRANAVVAAIGPRTVSYAILRNGAREDYPAYGVPTPSFSGIWDIASRYAGSGSSGTGIMRRDATRSVITTPSWEVPQQPNLPDMGQVLAATPEAKRVFEDLGVRVFALKDPDAMIAATHVLCNGNPGLLDSALSLPALRHVDFAEPSAACAANLFVNPDPRDAFAFSPNAVSGNTLCPSCQHVTEVDDQFSLGPLVLNDPWFRQSIGGSAALFGSSGAVALFDGESLNVPTPIIRSGDRRLAIRIASQAYATIDVIANGDVATIHLSPFTGFRWFEVDLPDGVVRNLRLVAHIDTLVPSDDPSPWHGLALDGVVAEDGLPPNVTDEQNDPIAITFASGDFSTAAPSESSDVQYLRQPANGTSAIFRWIAPSQEAALAISGHFAKGDVIDVDTGSTQRAFAVPSNLTAKSDIVLDTSLRRGKLVTVTAHGRRHVPRISAVSAVPALSRLRLLPRTPTLLAADLDFTFPRAAMQQLRFNSPSLHVASPSVGLMGRTGTDLSTTILLPPGKNNLIIGLWQLTGKGHVRMTLSCGGRSEVESINAASTVGLAITTTAPTCDVKLRWIGSVNVARLFALDTRSSSYARLVPVEPGTYNVRLYDSALRSLPTSSVFVNGTHLSRDSSLMIVKRGYVLITNNTSSGPGILLLLPADRDIGDNHSDISFKQTAAIRYALRVLHPTDIKIAHLDDGNWILAGSTRKYSDIRCDLVATCFLRVAPGNYTIYHRMPTATVLGFLITSVTALLAALLLFVSDRRLLEQVAVYLGRLQSAMRPR